MRLNPEHGLDAILRLVNQATANWAELRKGEAQSLLPWGEMAGWKGDVEVYAWYRQHLWGPVIVTSALMALEKWLYEMVEEGRDIGSVLARIFAESRSVAFAGVLVALGKKTPEFFAGPLLPLLSAWPLYRWDRIAIEHCELIRSDLPEFVDFGERIFEIVRSWNLLPHRRVPLLRISLDLLLKRPELADAFESFRARWQEQLEWEAVEISDELEQLIAFFDPSNYTSSDVESFEYPEHLREKNERELSAVGPDLAAEGFTENCRAALRDRTPLSSEESEQVWGMVVELDRLAREKEGFSRWTDAVAAGIAVLLDLSRDWITREPNRIAWCRERLAAMLENPPAPDILDNGSSPPILWQSPSFIAIAGVLLLALDGNDLLARRIVAEQIVSLRENRIALTFRYGFQERRRLGEDWRRMQSLAVLGAALRSVGQPAGDPADDILHSWASRLVRWFVQRKIRPEGPRWEKAARVALRLRERLYQKEDERNTGEFAPQRFPPVSAIATGFNLAALRAAFAWLPRLEEAHDQDERQEWIHLHRELLDVTERKRRELDRIGPEANFELWGSNLLLEHEDWLFPYLARLIPQLAAPDERRSFWEPAFRSFRGAETFMRAWFSEGPNAVGSSESFVMCWEEMIRYALSSPDLDLDTSYLLGVDWRATKILSEEFRPALKRFSYLYKQWAEGNLRGTRQVERFARFLVRPAALDLVCPGICWLQGALLSLESERRDDEENDRLDRALVEVLRVGWTHFQDRVRADPALLSDFQDFLSWLAGRGGAAALDLREEVRQSLLLPTSTR